MSPRTPHVCRGWRLTVASTGPQHSPASEKAREYIRSFCSASNPQARCRSAAQRRGSRWSPAQQRRPGTQLRDRCRRGLCASVPRRVRSRDGCPARRRARATRQSSGNWGL